MATTLNHPQHKLIYAALLVQLLGFSYALQQVSATGSSAGDPQAAASTSGQPLWAYQAKPINHHVAGSSSLLDTLSQRQGALSSSPFLSILPIILIAAGGMLLLLPFLTMMIASPFSGALGGGPFGGGPGGPFGYPQMVAALGKRRSLADSANMYSAGNTGKGPLEIIEHVSSLIDEISKKYSGVSGAAAPAVASKKQAAK